MATLASPPALQRSPARHERRRAETAALTAPLRADAPAPRLAVDRSAPRPYESAVDRYAFYFFMGTIVLGILAMIAMSFTI